MYENNNHGTSHFHFRYTMNQLCEKFKKQKNKENHNKFKEMIRYHRDENPDFNRELERIIGLPSAKSIARRDKAKKRRVIQEQVVQEARRIAAERTNREEEKTKKKKEAEKKRIEAEEIANRNREYVSVKLANIED